MEMALYDPDGGYYTTRAAIGEGGDFVTAPTISPQFARAVARRFAQDARRLEGPLVFLEAGAGAGTFLRDFRGALAEIAADVSVRTRLWALERAARGREAIERGGEAERIFRDAAEVPPDSLTGWVFSSELYDALPVHRVQMREGTLLELGVTSVPPLPAGEGRGEGAPSPAASPRPLPRGEATAVPETGPSGTLEWTSWPAPPELSAYLARFGIQLDEGQIAEINLHAAPLHRALGRTISSGSLVALDYGHRAGVLYHSHARPRGTLAVHSRGRRGGDPLENPGLVDLTAHVNWDDLVAAGESEGFRTDGIVRLSRFLLESGLFEGASRDRLSAHRLFDPEGLGDAMSVLIQSKGV